MLGSRYSVPIFFSHSLLFPENESSMLTLKQKHILKAIYFIISVRVITGISENDDPGPCEDPEPRTP